MVVLIAFAGELGRFLNRVVRNQSNRETIAWEEKYPFVLFYWFEFSPTEQVKQNRKS